VQPAANAVITTSPPLGSNHPQTTIANASCVNFNVYTDESDNDQFLGNRQLGDGQNVVNTGCKKLSPGAAKLIKKEVNHLIETIDQLLLVKNGAIKPKGVDNVLNPPDKDYNNAILTGRQKRAIINKLQEEEKNYAAVIAEVTNNYPQSWRTDVVEIGPPAGSTALMTAIQTKGGNYKRWDRVTFDLALDSGFAKAQQQLSFDQPRHLFLSPPATSFTTTIPARPTSQQSQRYHMLLTRQKKIWSRSMQLALLQISRGGQVTLHHPSASTAWDKMAREDNFTCQVLRKTQQVLHDDCLDGLVDNNGLPVKKQHRFQTTQPEVFRELNKTCKDNHEHSSEEPVFLDFSEKLATKLATGFMSHKVGICAWFECLAEKIMNDDSEANARPFWDPHAEICLQCSATPSMGYPVTPGYEFTGTGQWPLGKADMATEPAYPAHELLRDPSDVADKDPEEEFKKTQWNKLRAIHKNLGHPSNRVMQQILRDAGATKNTIDLAGQLTCDVCSRFRHTAPARPAKAHRARELGEVLGLDLSVVKLEGGKAALLLHLIDEASKFHVIRVIKEGILDNHNALGNITGPQLVDTLQQCWYPYFQTPKAIHCDSEGVFRAKEFLDSCQDRGIRVITTAGEAHWQLGIVERHIKTATELIQKLILDSPSTSRLQEIVDSAAEAKNSFGHYGGFSPAQWQLARTHPLTRTSEVPPGDEEDTFFQHVRRRELAAKGFMGAEAKSILRIASLAKARQLTDVKVSDIVYYWRRGKAATAKQRGTYRGPARVIAVELPEGDNSNAVSIIWLAHGTQLIRAAPEHLRQATPLEISVSEYIQGPAANPQQFQSQTLRQQRVRYVDLGARPDAAELNEDDHNDDDALGKQVRGEDREPDRSAKRTRFNLFDPGRPQDGAISVPIPAGPPVTPAPHSVIDADIDNSSEATSFNRPDTPTVGDARSDIYRGRDNRAEDDRSRSGRGRPVGRHDPVLGADKPISQGPEDPADEDMFPPGQRPQVVHPAQRWTVLDSLKDNGLGHLRPFEEAPPELAAAPTPGVAPPATPQEVAQPATPAAAATPPELTQSLYVDNTIDNTINENHELNSVTTSNCRLGPEHGDNAQFAYHSMLSSYQRRAAKQVTPNFAVNRASVNPSKLRKSQWANHVFEFMMDVEDEDTQRFNECQDSPELLSDNFALMAAEAKRHAEVNLRHLTKAEQAEFEAAKRKELDQWLSHAVFSIAKKAGIPTSRIMSMRWVLTWKVPDGSTDVANRTAKARLVVKGFTDPDLTTIRAEAPTLSRMGKHLLLQLAASNGWQLTKGDVKTAFLQGDSGEGKREVYAQPTAEIRKILNMSDTEIMKLERAVYGLRNAPRAWYTRLRADLLKIGARQHQLDSCLFMVYEGANLVGMIGVYVDDCLIAGNVRSKAFKTFTEKLKTTYKWSPWEDKDFVFTGTRLQQLPSGVIKMTQVEYCKQLRQVNLAHADPEADCSPQQLTQLRGADGSLQWLAVNTRMDLAAPVSIAQGNHSNPKIRHLQDSNKLIRTAYNTADTPMYIQPIPLSELSLVTFHDAGQGSRPDGSSQGGYVIIAATKGILEGKEAACSTLDWKSFKLKRVARSSLSAEVQAFAEALDALEFLKLMLAEAQSSTPINLRRDTDKLITTVCPACLVTDCKSLYDAVERSQSTGLQLSERRTSIEVLACRERLEATKMHVRWVNSDRQLADGLTKASAAWKLQNFQRKPVWKLIFDPNYTAAKKLRVTATKAKTTTSTGAFPEVPPAEREPVRRASHKKVSRPTFKSATSTKMDANMARLKELRAQFNEACSAMMS